MACAWTLFSVEAVERPVKSDLVFSLRIRNEATALKFRTLVEVANVDINQSQEPKEVTSMLGLGKRKTGNNELSWFPRSRLIALSLFVCALLAGAGIWPLKLIQIGQAGQQNLAKLEFDAKQVKDQMRRGLGRQVRFASPGDSPERVSESVWQVDKFIYERSGLKMSRETRERLIAMESRALKGEGHRIGIEEFTDALTETAVERMSKLTDQEIEESRKTFLADGQVIHTRASGGSLLEPERFVEQAKALRDEAQGNDKPLPDAARNLIAAEMKSRAALLGETLPQDFGRASTEGLTPLQAVVVTYSVASDDQLNGSPGELQEAVSRINQEKGRGTVKGLATERAYGVNGRVFATPVNLLFNPKTFNSFLDRIEKGGAK